MKIWPIWIRSTGKYKYVILCHSALPWNCFVWLRIPTVNPKLLRKRKRQRGTNKQWRGGLSSLVLPLQSKAEDEVCGMMFIKDPVHHLIKRDPGKGRSKQKMKINGRVMVSSRQGSLAWKESTMRFVILIVAVKRIWMGQGGALQAFRLKSSMSNWNKPVTDLSLGYFSGINYWVSPSLIGRELRCRAYNWHLAAFKKKEIQSVLNVSSDCNAIYHAKSTIRI